MINYTIIYDDGIRAAFGIRAGNLMIMLKKIIMEKMLRNDFSTARLFQKYPPSNWLK